MVKKLQPIPEIQHGGRCHLEFSKIFTFDATFAFYVRFSTCPPNLVTIGSIVMKWQPIFEIQDGGGRHLEITLPVEPPLWERNFWFVTCNQKSNFCEVILTFKGSLLLRALMLKQFPLQIGKVRKRVEMLLFFGLKTPKNKFEGSKPPKGTCTNQNTSFELLNVWIGSELRPAGEMGKWKKKYIKVTKPLHFTTV